MASKKWRLLFYRLVQIVLGERTNTAKQSLDPEQKDEVNPQTNDVPLLPPKQVWASNQLETSVTESKSNVGLERKTEQQSNQSNQLFDGVPANAYQFGPNDGNPLDIVVGVDFGTSSTKVVVRAPYYTGTPAFAVPFGDLAHKSLEYLLPTWLFVDKDGNCSLTSMPGASILTDIKIGLMQNPLCRIESASGPPWDVSAITVSAAYLALVLRYVRCWFLANKRGIFGEFTLRWSFNLGLPAAIDDDPKLREAFDISGKAAWILSKRTGPITIDAAQDAIKDIKCSTVETDFAFDLIPEVIAEVMGYARSISRNDGLHLLVDVGASTLDVCSFNLHVREGDDHFPILTADVDLLGAKRLHSVRIDGTGAANPVDESDPGNIIPDDIEAYVEEGQEAGGEILGKIVTAENSFKDKCEKLLRRTIIDLRMSRYPLAPCWDGRLPIFVCGGAKSMRMYRGVVSDIHNWLREKYIPSSQGIRQIELPKPESLDAKIDDESYHRLAVAWGLSYESFNIGIYTRPDDIDNVSPPPVQNHEGKYISKDMV